MSKTSRLNPTTPTPHPAIADAPEGRSKVEVGDGDGVVTVATVLKDKVPGANVEVAVTSVEVAVVQTAFAPPFTTLHPSEHHPSRVWRQIYPCMPSSECIGSPGASSVHDLSKYQLHMVLFGPWHCTPWPPGVSRTRTLWPLSGQLVTQIHGPGVAVAVIGAGVVALVRIAVPVGGIVVVDEQSVGAVRFRRTTSPPTLHQLVPVVVSLHLIPPVSSRFGLIHGSKDPGASCVQFESE